eukprot:16973-Heterococcus_DN1.PRE.2
MAAAKQKRIAADNSPLLHPGVLHNVLSYVGRGHHLFVVPVSSVWRDAYAAVKSQQLTICDDYSEDVITCVPQMTLYSSVFTFPSTACSREWAGLHLSCMSACCRQAC